jgi:DNA repair protein SbcC/Rad50
MILRSIELENIRSYKDRTVIDFPYGRTLFQGDIGSGKSTILSAVEFALFGLGDIDAEHLLRVGSARGSVFLEFESNKQVYKVYRSLARKRDKIVQNEGYLYENGKRSSYAVSELKTKILDIIKINERSETKTTSVVYRYAVYTPQEMMKQILSSNNEKRLDILRRAFGIEEYSTAKRNAEKFLSGIRILLKSRKDLVADLEEYRSNLTNKQELVTNSKKDMERISSLIKELEDRVIVLDGELAQLAKTKEQLLEIDLSLKSSKTHLTRYEKEKASKLEELNRLEQDLSRAEESLKIITDLESPYKDLMSKRSELTTLADSAMAYDRLVSEKARFEAHIKSEADKFDAECSRLKSDITAMNAEIEYTQEATSNLDSLSEREKYLSQNVAALTQLRKDFQNASDGLSQTSARMKSVENEISNEQSQIDNILKLSHQAVCPCCGQKLTSEHVTQMVERFKQKKAVLEKDCSALNDACMLFESKRNEVGSKIEENEKLEVELNSLRVEISGLTAKRLAAANASEKMKEAAERLKILTQKLESSDFAGQEKTQLRIINSELESLSGAKGMYANCQSVIVLYQNDNIEKRYLDNQSIAQSKAKTVEQTQFVQKSIVELDKDINEAAEKIPKLEASYKLKSDDLEQLPKLESERATVAEQMSEYKQQLAVKSSVVKEAHENILEICKKVESLRKKYEELQYMDNMARWLDDCFIPSLDTIEALVMKTINEGFAHQFQKWFNLLVDSPDIMVELDECFAPLIHQNGHKMEVDTLSGGEKTAVAMAYRLALNEVIKRLADMDDNLLILDEPTDGFSKEQVYQLKHVFDSLSASQVIIVSHEKELEGFVECTCRVSKEGDCSNVSVP